jgi:hypothetical protein
MLSRFGNAWVGMFLAFVCLSLVIAGCGGGSSSTSSSTEASKQFLLAGHSNKLPKFGEEASADELEEADAIVAAMLKARAAADFAAQCTTLSKQEIAAIPGVKNPRECVKALEELAAPLAKTKKVRSNTLKGSIGALRVKGDKAWALYHGTDGNDYAVPLEKEDGVWKVTSLVTTEL